MFFVFCSTPFNADTNHPTNKMDSSRQHKKSIVRKLFSGQELLTTLTIISTVLAVLIGLVLRKIWPPKE